MTYRLQPRPPRPPAHPGLAALAFTLAVLPLAARAQPITLEVAEDSWTHGLDSASTQGGAAVDLGICPRAGYWIYLKFDLSQVEGRVLEAELRMNRFEGSRPEEISAYSIPDDDWSEATLSGTARPDPRSPDPSAAIALGQAIPAAHDRWASAALALAVRQEAQGDGVLTLMVREDPSTQFDVRRYLSREGGDPAERPRLVLVLDSSERVAEGWRTADVGAGIKPSFAFAPDGTVHVMGMTEAHEGVVWHASAAALAGPWSPETIATGYFYGPGDIACDADGNAHIAWHNHEEEDPNHAIVAAGGGVVRHRITSPGHNGWDNALAFGDDGVLHQSSVNPVSFGAGTSLEHGTFDGMEWDYGEVAGSGSFMYGLATSVAVDRDGRPHVAYCRANDWTDPGDLMYAVLGAEGWEVATVVTGGARGRFPSLALDHWDRPHLAWLDVDSAEPSVACVRYAVLNAERWEVEDVDTLSRVNLSFDGARKSVSLALDGNSRPRLAYGDQRALKYARKPFGSWEITTVLEDEDELYKGLAVLRLDRDGRPAIAFWQIDPESPLPGAVRLAFPSGAVEPPAGSQRPGDCNQDAEIDISDPVCLLFQLFLAATEPLPCGDGTLEATGNLSLLDVDQNGAVDLTDPTHLLNFLFLGGPPPDAGAGCVPIAGCPEVCA
jgi:hypothetical protein